MSRNTKKTGKKQGKTPANISNAGSPVKPAVVVIPPVPEPKFNYPSQKFAAERTRAPNDAWKGAFIVALGTVGTVTGAAAIAGVSRRAAQLARKGDPEFDEDWNDALDQFADTLEAEAYRRAVEGTLKPVFQGGACVGYIREYSDTMMALLLKAKRPEQYSTQTQNNFNFTPDDLSKMTVEQLQRVKEGKLP